MGRESRMRKEAKEAKNKTMARWAQENPERFEKEWAKKVNSWIGQVWSASKDRVFLTKEDYEKLLTKHSTAKAGLESIEVRLYNGIGDYYGVHIYLNALNNLKEELGSEVVGEILSHVKRGTLVGDRIFGIVDNAKKTLLECGEKAVELQFLTTTDLLNNECCRAIAQHTSDKLRRVNTYSINQEFEEHGKYKVTRGNKTT